MPEFLITGATGTVGRALLRLLTARGATIRALSRHPQRGAVPAGVEPYAGDLNDPAAVRDALTGVRRVFLLTGGPDSPGQDRTVADAAAVAGVEHLVKLSVLGLTEGADDPITAWHRAGEDAVVRSGVPATFIRPGAFMSNTLNWTASMASGGAVYAPVGDLPVACIDPIDIAAVAYHLLTHPGPPGQAYPVTGPEAISPRQQAAVLGDLLGRTVRFVDITAAQARDQMVSYGMPEALADGVIGTMTSPLHGHNQTPLPTVEQVTGLPPRTFRQWASAHVDDFAHPTASP